MRNKLLPFLLFTALLLFSCFGCSAQQADGKIHLMVSAAASLSDVLNELKTTFENEHPDITITYNYASSGKLAQQIQQGAPADVFLSASKKDMDSLSAKSLISTDTRINFAENELVLIANKNSSQNVSSFEQIPVESLQHFAIGEPESVPAGRYAKEVLDKLALWDKLQNKLVYANDVRQVLAYVESGNADYGVVYASDAAISKEIKVLAASKKEWHQPIVYPAAVIASSTYSKEAKTFIDYLGSSKGKELLVKYGFR